MVTATSASSVTAEPAAVLLVSLQHRVLRQWVHRAGLDLAQLGIVSAKKCWLLHIDALIIGVDGSLADATSLAVKVRPCPTDKPVR
jgi:exosome complex RNA-binding protein Rrp42 (RNase PH superfamily)